MNKHTIAALTAMASLLGLQTGQAGNATWNLNPASGDWNTATNWTPNTVPNGPDDIATFDASNTTSVSLSVAVELDSIVFGPSANAFAVTIPRLTTLNLNGGGLTNNSAEIQRFTVGGGITTSGEQGRLVFNNRSQADSRITYTAEGGGVVTKAKGGFIGFTDSASAGHATFILNAGTASAADGAELLFENNTTASNATIVTMPFGLGSAGKVEFHDASSAGRARIIDNGDVDIGFHTAPGVTISSLEGSDGTGAFYLGANNLTVGTSGRTTIFAGAIWEGGDAGGTGGSLTKVGAGSLTVNGYLSYSGDTVVEGGQLLVNSSCSSPIKVNQGTLGGGSLSMLGPVTVGSSSGSGANLSPGTGGDTNIGKLLILNTLTFNADGAYHCGLKTRNGIQVDVVSATGVTINSGAQFVLSLQGTGTLAVGRVFKVILNTGAGPIAGEFANLADGSTITVGTNTFQANYEGGDGNDLTLTVVP